MGKNVEQLDNECRLVKKKKLLWKMNSAYAKLNIHISHGPAIPFLCTCILNRNVYIYFKCTTMFTVAI